MAIDARIPLGIQTEQINPNALSDISAAQQQGQVDRDTNAMNEQKLTQERYNTLEKRDKQRLDSVIMGAAQLKPFIEAGDIEGADRFLASRQEDIQKAKALGVDIDDDDTVTARKQLRENPQELLTTLDGFINLGKMTGVLTPPKGSTTPSAVQEFEYFQGLPPEEQTKFLNVKRQTLTPGLVINNQGDAAPINNFSQLSSGIEGDKARAKEKGKLDVQPPETREVKDGSRVLTQEFNRETNQFETIAESTDTKALDDETKREKASIIQEDALRIIGDLLNEKSAIKNVVGPVDSNTPSLKPSSLRAQTRLKQLRSILTAENLGIMTGVLSETDLKVIADIAGGGLDMGGDDDLMVDELERLQSKFARGLKAAKVKQGNSTGSPIEFLGFE